ncbi:MAG: hypoxanthine phosphoribosyltransferase [Nitrospinae bacterium]|nr:hypoxanthine phosphoribosyltransferase [Nitrospinota bacterium]
MKAVPCVRGGATLTLLFSQEAIAARVREMAAQINRDYAGRTLLLVGVLKGAFVFLADLMRQLQVPVEVELIRLASYGSGTTSAGYVRVRQDVERPIAGRHVLIVEDLLDTGLTLRYLLEELRTREPASLKVCVLLHKHSRIQHPLSPAYVGFEVGEGFVVGYGIDYAEQYRHLPDLYTLTWAASPP